MAFRILNQAPQYFLADGTPNAFGFLATFENGTTTDKATWSDKAMTVLNPNPIPLDSSGRTTVDVWGDGVYSVQLQGSLHEEIWTRDDVEDTIAGGSVFPPGDPGQFLTTDGTNVSFVDIFQMPDPTGSTNQVPLSNGSGYTLTNLPAAPTLDIVTANGSLRVGDGVSTNKVLIQWGIATCAATNLPTATHPIVFPTAYTLPPDVFLLPNTQSNVAPVVCQLTSAASITGFTAAFDLAEGNPAQANIVNPIPFYWIAVGNKTVP